MGTPVFMLMQVAMGRAVYGTPHITCIYHSKRNKRCTLTLVRVSNTVRNPRYAIEPIGWFSRMYVMLAVWRLVIHSVLMTDHLTADLVKLP